MNFVYPLITSSAGAIGGFSPRAFDITSPPQGAWPWGNAHKIGNYTYIAFATNAGGMRLAIWDHLMGAQVAPVASRLESDGFVTADQHDCPALIQRSDGRLLAVYMPHAGANAYQRISVNTLGSDPTISGGWNTRTDIDSQLGGTAYTYPDLHHQDGSIYLFYRDQDVAGNNWEWSRSTDDGATWSTLVNVCYGTRYYARSFSSGGTRIDFVICNGSYAEDQASMYHFYRSGTSYYKTDGTVIGGSPPFTVSAFTKIWDGPAHSAGSRAPGDLLRIGSEVAVVWPIQTGTPSGHIGADEDYLYARSNGGAWSVSTVAANIGALTFEFTEGMLVIDRANLDRLLVSRRAVSDLAYPFRMYDVTSLDGGATWPTGRVVSVNDGNGATYAAFVRGGSSDLEAVWLQGPDYTSQNVFSTGIVGYGFDT